MIGFKLLAATVLAPMLATAIILLYMTASGIWLGKPTAPLPYLIETWAMLSGIDGVFTVVLAIPAHLVLYVAGYRGLLPLLGAALACGLMIYLWASYSFPPATDHIFWLSLWYSALTALIFWLIRRPDLDPNPDTPAP